MPTISYFYGIAISMFFGDHNPPHFHARHGRAKALVRIADGEIIAGDRPEDGERMGTGAARRIGGKLVPRKEP